MRNNRTDDRPSSSDCVFPRKREEVGSQPLMCGKVLNHAALPTSGNVRPDLVLKSLYRTIRPGVQKKAIVRRNRLAPADAPAPTPPVTRPRARVLQASARAGSSS